MTTTVCNHLPRPSAAASTVTLRRAGLHDAAALRALHHLCLRELGGGFYTPAQIESLLRHMETLDPALIDDRTYFVAEAGGAIVACGGWSARLPSYHAAVAFDAPARGAPARAWIRAMYTHPAWARRGLARRILAAAEAQMAAAGHRQAELDALLPGVPLYRACGYRALGQRSASLPDGQRLAVVQMARALSD